MINKIQSQSTFTGKSQLKSNIKLARRVFFAEFADVKKPASYSSLPKEKQAELAKEIKESNMILRVIRELQRTAFEEGGNYEVFRRLIGMLKTFKVGNCAELAETGKTICKMNGLKNCDIFTLHAKSPDGKVRELDQTIIAFKVPNSLNNRATKKNGTLFTPKKDTIIFDLYMNGFYGNVRQSRKLYKGFGLKPEDKLLFKPENTYEPNKETLNKLKQTFPKLVFNK